MGIMFRSVVEQIAYVPYAETDHKPWYIQEIGSTDTQRYSKSTEAATNLTDNLHMSHSLRTIAAAVLVQAGSTRSTEIEHGTHVSQRGVRELPPPAFAQHLLIC
jgi:hypothetical protein